MKPGVLRRGVQIGAAWLPLVWLAISLAATKVHAEVTVTLASDPATDACIQDRACIKAAFLAAALGGGKSADGQPAGRIVKWSGAIRAGVLGAESLPTERHEVSERAFNLVGMIGREAGIDMRASRGDPTTPINLLMFVSDDFERDRDSRFGPIIEKAFRGRKEIYDAVLASGRGPVCRGQWYVGRNHAVSGAIVMIESDLPTAQFERCIYTNMLNVLGMPGPLSGPLDSILNQAARRSSWTALDFVLLEILYHPLIQPGMTAREVDQVFAKVHAEVLKGLG